MSWNRYQSEAANFIAKSLQKRSEDIIGLLEFPPDISLGDYAFPCFTLAKELKKSPGEIAKELSQKFKPTGLLRSAAPAGGYINFSVNRESFVKDIVSQVLEEKEKFGKSTSRGGERIVIDYSSPNVAKPFSIAHLRSTILGQTLTNIFCAHGFEVIGINHLGDWGTQFGKQIVALKRWGSPEDLISSEKPIEYLFNLYVKFHDEAEKNPALEDEAREMFAKTEAGDKEARSLRDLLVEYSLKDFNKTYKRLGVSFTYVRGESFYTDKIDESLKKIESLVKTRMSEGALVIDLEKHGMPPLLLKKKDGATLYATRDLTAIMQRHEEFKFEQILYVVGQEQTLHFKQLFAALDEMKLPWAHRCHHIPFGMIRFRDKRMSTRKGNVIFLNDVLDEARKRALKAIELKNPELKHKEDVAEKVGIGAVIFNDISQRRIKDVTFDWDEMLSFEGNTGPYLQYTHARICSILRKSEEKVEDARLELLKEPEEFALVKMLELYPMAITKAIAQYEPSIVCTALLDIASAFNTFYHKHQVLKSEPNLRTARLKLIDAVRQTLSNGLALINISTPDEM